jgi:tRNA 2-thiouridine synthesizing protein B
MLYLVDRPLAEVAFRTVARDEDARVVLIQDGVLLDPDVDCPTHAVARDAEVRGVDLPPGVEAITYDTLMEMVVEHETKSFV